MRNWARFSHKVATSRKKPHEIATSPKKPHETATSRHAPHAQPATRSPQPDSPDSRSQRTRQPAPPPDEGVYAYAVNSSHNVATCAVVVSRSPELSMIQVATARR